MDFEDKFIIEDGHISVAKTPKVITTNNYDIYMGTEVDLDESYHQLIHLLRHEITKKDTVTMHLGNFGGSCHAGVQIINAIKQCKAPVHMQVEFPSYSMGALLAIAGTSLTMEPNTFLMFHNYSGGSRGKGAELVKGVNETHKWLMGMFISICKPFLTDHEVDRLIEDKDVYIHATDRTLKARTKRHFKNG